MTPLEYYELIERSLDAQLKAAHQNDWASAKRIHRAVRLLLAKHFEAMLTARLTVSEAESQLIGAIVERINAKDKELFELAKASNEALSSRRLH